MTRPRMRTRTKINNKEEEDEDEDEDEDEEEEKNRCTTSKIKQITWLASLPHYLASITTHLPASHSFSLATTCLHMFTTIKMREQTVVVREVKVEVGRCRGLSGMWSGACCGVVGRCGAGHVVPLPRITWA
ncbi:hypothetical protein E2C01_005700 [Portunus trituberculatus]|uniref:Uncharacterized protein n=1 Tax=Portunus trituberculatus TaxID=210409 RepID=A0A5B7CTD7_PORTR|nr:hypothetical protein [Portunus trituberculatus]